MFILLAGGLLVIIIAVVIAVYALSNTSVAVASIWTSIYTGIIGIVLQLIVIPPVVKSLEGKIH